MLRTSPVLLVIFPKVERLVGLKLAPPQFGWLKMLNACARNWIPVFSVIENFLKRPAFQLTKPGLWITFRKPAACVLNVPVAGWVQSSLPLESVVVNQYLASALPLAAIWWTMVGVPFMTQNWPPPDMLPSWPTPA